MSDSWLDSALAASEQPVQVDISHLRIPEGDGFKETIEVRPLSAKEYQVLKSHPDIRASKDADDKMERLGLLVTYEMMKKCDDTLKFDTFKALPLTLLNDLSTAILAATRGGGGSDDPLGQ